MRILITLISLQENVYSVTISSGLIAQTTATTTITATTTTKIKTTTTTSTTTTKTKTA